MSSFSVNARGQAVGSVIAACRRWSRVIASTRLAGVRSAAQTMRLRCGVISIPYEAMTETTSGCGGSPSPIIPAERTGTVTPSVASRRASSAAAIGDRHTFAVHSMRTPGSAGVSRCAGGIWEMPSLSFILILPKIIFRPLLGPVRGTFRDRMPCLVWTFILSRLRLSYTHFLQRTPGDGASTGFPWSLRSWVPTAATLQTRENSDDDRIGYRADISRLPADPAPAKMVGWLDHRARPGAQPGVLAHRAQAVLGHRPAAGAAVRQCERA